MTPTQPHVPRIVSEYLQNYLDPVRLAERTDAMAKTLAKHEFEAIAFRGVSGALLAPILSVKLGKTLLVVRKPGESNHSGALVEGDFNARRYVIVDDFQSSGATVKAIIKAIGTGLTCVGCVFAMNPENFRPIDEDGRAGGW